jgi:hypothetical protein
MWRLKKICIDTIALYLLNLDTGLLQISDLYFPRKNYDYRKFMKPRFGENSPSCRGLTTSDKNFAIKTVQELEILLNSCLYIF